MNILGRLFRWSQEKTVHSRTNLTPTEPNADAKTIERQSKYPLILDLNGKWVMYSEQGSIEVNGLEEAKLLAAKWGSEGISPPRGYKT